MIPGENSSTISCCNSETAHPECFPVKLDKEDPFYQDYNVTCMEFVRSAPAPTCRFGTTSIFCHLFLKTHINHFISRTFYIITICYQTEANTQLLLRCRDYNLIYKYLYLIIKKLPLKCNSQVP